MAGGAVIRELRKEDSGAVAQLQLAINPEQLVTPAMIWQRATREIEREQRRDWVAELDGEIVGYAQANFEWSVPTPGKGRLRVNVLPKRRNRGIGRELYARADQYLRERGAWRLRSWVDNDPAGARFLQQRGFEQRDADRVSALDLRAAALPTPNVPDGFRVVPLAEARHRVDDLFEICAAGEIDMPGDEPETELHLESWKQDDFGVPTLSDEGSFVALAGGRAVALAFLLVDPDRELAYNHMTATLPKFRRNGLALAVKVAAARWAAENGIDRILTENDADNAGMLAINDLLGYRFLYEQTGWVLEWERPPEESR